MLSRMELIWGFLGAWIISSILLFFLKKTSKGKLPSGCLMIEIHDSLAINQLVGSIWTRSMILIGFGIGSITVIGVILFSVFDLWNSVSDVFIFDFPNWINWVGLVMIWISYIWGTLVLYYNPNYTPLYSTLTKTYILATGGPYKIIRHPMYVQKAVFPILVFLTTGIWLSLFGLISWIALPKQTQLEENLLKNIYGKPYEEYKETTGKFFPKLTNN